MGKASPQRNGAQALLTLLRAIHAQTEADLVTYYDSFGDEDVEDPRDYPEVCKLIADSIAANVTNAGEAHREGYLRGLADLICVNVDGCGVTVEGWDPLAVTAASFEAAKRTEAAMKRAHGGRGLTCRRGRNLGASAPRSFNSSRRSRALPRASRRRPPFFRWTKRSSSSNAN